MKKAIWLAAAMTLPAGASAESKFDGKTELLCAVIEAAQCAKTQGQAHVCARGLAAGLGLPQFVRVDFAGKRIVATEESGVEDTSVIASVGSGDNHLTVQGVDGGHAWSIVIEQSTGAMSASVVGDEEGILVFGACTGI